jgi:tRNA dimethylallyltransferase
MIHPTPMAVKGEAASRWCLPAGGRAAYKDGVETRVIVITGCTACGKGALARHYAGALGAEIISVDSMKVYRGLDIGTAKPPPAVRAALPHHLIDVADAWDAFSAARFVELADEAVSAIHARGRPVVAVGGTVLYLKCWYEGLFEGPAADPVFRAALRQRAAEIGGEALHAELARVDSEAAQRIHPNDLRRIERALEVHALTGQPISALQQQWTASHRRRPEWSWRLVGLRRPREQLNQRINQRVRNMVQAGLVEEARRVWADPRGVSDQARQAVGYAELFAHFEGRLTAEEAVEQIKIHSRRLAKQQRTWLRRMPDVDWLDVAEGDSAETLAERLTGP